MNNEYIFPHADSADSQGLVYIGGDLNPNRILTAYQRGIFPWYNEGNPILWWSPNPRMIFIPDEFHVSKSLKKSLRNPHFHVTFDTAFHEVIHTCATVNNRLNNTWINTDMQQAYLELFHMGYAHSVEVWEQGTLIGGLYGISIGKAFFGESMFHVKTDASKIALFYLCRFAHQHQFHFIDCQFTTAHLLSLGGKQIKRKDYLHRLAQALSDETLHGPWKLT
jgi:leucyl/phenylalanyl-tRNA--protein transferase